MASAGLESDSRHSSVLQYPSTPSAGPSRSDSCDGQIVHSQSAVGLAVGGLNIKHDATLAPIDLNTSWHAGDDRRTLLSPISDGHGEEDGYGSRRRNRSISFDPEAKLENGGRHALVQPLPRTASLRSVSTADRPNNRRASGAQGPHEPVVKINPFTGEPIRRIPRRSDTASTGMSIMDALSQTVASPVGVDQLISLTSASTVSPPQDDVATPGSPGNSILDSDAVSPGAVSPSLEGEPWPPFRAGSIRSSRTFPSRPLSLRRESRRSSRRSASSSFSPAAIYLAKWGRDSVNAAPDPDDEGQSFGLENEYIIGRQIGYGGFSVVKEAFSVSPDGERRKHAVKIVRKNIAAKAEADNEKCQQELEHEVGMWKYLSNERILSLHAVFDTDFATFCVMDLNEGGSLYDLVRDSRKSGTSLFRSGLARTYSFQLAEALRYLHEDVRIVHRDVKMENCLIDRRPDLSSEASASNSGNLRLCDFGLAEFISADDTPGPATSADGAGEQDAKQQQPAAVHTGTDAIEVVGSLESSAPEALRSTRDATTSSAGPILSPSVDVWAYGVCVFTLVALERPFRDALASRVVELILAARWDETIVRTATGDDPDAEHVFDLLRGCLEKNVGRRWDIARVLASPWFGAMRDDGL